MPHPLAGQPAPASVLVDLARLIDAYHSREPDLADPEQLVAFGTTDRQLRKRLAKWQVFRSQLMFSR